MTETAADSYRRVSMVEYPIRTVVHNHPLGVREAGHPRLVRYEPGFLGLPTRIVEEPQQQPLPVKVTVPQFLEQCRLNRRWNYQKPVVTRTRKTCDLDSIIALQYFTGLRNFSFKESYAPYLGYRDYYDSWRNQLRLLTEQAYVPILDKKREAPRSTAALMTGSSRPATVSGSKSSTRGMYSRSGRLREGTVSRKSTPTTTSRSRTAPDTVRPMSKPDPVDLNDLDAGVFLLLSNILQTDSPVQVQKWLCHATDREKAMIINMIQASLNNEAASENVDPAHVDRSTQTSHMTKRQSQVQLIDVGRISSASNDSSRGVDRLVLDPVVVETDEGQDHRDVVIRTSVKRDITSPAKDFRPPTSSTFKSAKANQGARQANRELMWRPEESVDN